MNFTRVPSRVEKSSMTCRQHCVQKEHKTFPIPVLNKPQSSVAPAVTHTYDLQSPKVQALTVKRSIYTWDVICFNTFSTRTNVVNLMVSVVYLKNVSGCDCNDRISMNSIKSNCCHSVCYIVIKIIVLIQSVLKFTKIRFIQILYCQKQMKFQTNRQVRYTI